MANRRFVNAAARVSAAGEHHKATLWQRWKQTIVCGLVACLLSAAWGALAVTQVYDSNGRLIAEANDAGQAARYHYDDLGNMTKIDRLAVDDLAIFTFAPNRGAPGIAVSIKGHGFSPNAIGNAVTFNGAPADVIAASASELTVTVPIGATTGPISITVGSQSATSEEIFTLDPNAKPPSISAVSPLIAAAGTTITVDGQHLMPAQDQTTTSLGKRIAAPSTITETQIVFSMPAKAGSGRVTVTTPYGTAISEDEVVVVPPGISVANIAQVKRLAVDGAAEGFTVTTDGQYAAVLFDGVAGDYLSLQSSGLNVSSVMYWVYDTSNTWVQKPTTGLLPNEDTFRPQYPTGHLPMLPVTGTYLLLMKPSAVPATWNMRIERSKVVQINAIPLEITTTVMGEEKRLVFDAVAGQRLGLGIADLQTPGSTFWGKVNVYRPVGFQDSSQFCYASNGGCDLNLTALVAGRYTIEIVPPVDQTPRTLNLKVALSTEAVGELQPGVPLDLNIARRGQNGRLSIAGTAGQMLSINMTGQLTMPGVTNNPYEPEDVYYSVYKPDGTLFRSAAAKDGDYALTLPTLPESGIYTLFVDPMFGSTMAAQFVLDTQGTIQVDGDPVIYQSAVIDKNAYFTFRLDTDTPGLGLGLSDGSGGSMTMRVLRPDGTSVGGISGCGDRCGYNVPSLSAGMYSIEIDPTSTGGTANFKLTLSTDMATVLQRNVAYQMNLPRRGQNAKLTFAATAGETLVLQAWSFVTTPSDGAQYTVYKPDGSLLYSGSISSNLMLRLTGLPVTGTYTVLIDPNKGAAVTGSVLLSDGTSGGLEVDGPSVAFESAGPEQRAYFVFDAAEGQNVGLGISDLVTPGSTAYGFVRVYKPNGSQLTSSSNCYASNQGCDLNLKELPAGRYGIEVEAGNGGDKTMHFKITLSTEVAGQLQQDAPYSLNIARRGQNGRFTFSGTAGDSLALNLNGQATTPPSAYPASPQDVTYTVYKPDGTVLRSLAVDDGNYQLTLPTLPATGTYTVFVDPLQGAVTTVQMVLDTQGILSIDGEPVSYSSLAAGKRVYSTFKVVVDGANLGIGLTEGNGSTSSLYIYRPDGSSATGYYYSCATRCEANLINLPVGMYSFEMRPSSSSSTLSFKVTLSTDVPGTLQRGTPFIVNLQRPGQNQRLTFSGVTGELLKLQVGPQSTTPVNGLVYYRVYKPDGTSLTSDSTSSSKSINIPSLSVDGSYTVLVDPQYGSPTTTTVTLTGQAP